MKFIFQTALLISQCTGIAFLHDLCARSSAGLNQCNSTKSSGCMCCTTMGNLDCVLFFKKNTDYWVYLKSVGLFSEQITFQGELWGGITWCMLLKNSLIINKNILALQALYGLSSQISRWPLFCSRWINVILNERKLCSVTQGCNLKKYSWEEKQNHLSYWCLFSQNFIAPISHWTYRLP